MSELPKFGVAQEIANAYTLTNQFKHRTSQQDFDPKPQAVALGEMTQQEYDAKELTRLRAIEAAARAYLEAVGGDKVAAKESLRLALSGGEGK